MPIPRVSHRRLPCVLVGGVAVVLAVGCRQSPPPQKPTGPPPGVSAQSMVPNSAFGNSPQGQQMREFVRQKAQEGMSKAYGGQK